jgi:GntR family transcriptional regulator
MKQSQADARAAVSKPLYGQVREMLLGRIGRGEWGPGDSLPNEFILASQFEVSVGTIRRAIEGLEESGLVVRKQGRGTYVSGQGAQALQNKFTTLRSASGRALQLSYRTTHFSHRPATTAESVRLMLKAEDEVLEIEQSVHTTARQVGVEHVIVAADLLPEIREMPEGTQHLYALYSEHGILITRAEDRITTDLANAQIATELSLANGQPVIKVERLAYALEARPVEWRQSTWTSADISCAYQT